MINPTSAWIASVLHNVGMQIDDLRLIAVETNAAFNANVCHLYVEYAEEATPRPTRFILKQATQHDGAHEVAWYRQPKPQLSLFPTLYGCGYDQTSGDSWILLHDYSVTHQPPIQRDALIDGTRDPAFADCLGIVRALGTFHAAFWNDPRIATDDSAIFQVRPWYRTEAHFNAHIERRRNEWTQFCAVAPPWFPHEIRQRYETTLAGLPRLWETFLAPRVLTGQQMTISHGDCSLTQFLCPKQPQHPTILVDYDSVGGNFAAYDLAYLLPTFWDHDQRQRSELPLLREYHATLQQYGIDFTWDDVLRDYRAMLVLMLFDAVFNAVGGSSERYWWRKMQCLVAAFNDWDCQSLLG